MSFKVSWQKNKHRRRWNYFENLFSPNPAILPPPWLWHRYGNLQTLPSPTQKPTQVSRYWALLSHLGLSPASSFSIRSRSAWEGMRSSRPGLGSFTLNLTILASGGLPKLESAAAEMFALRRSRESAEKLCSLLSLWVLPQVYNLGKGLRYLLWPMVQQLSVAHYSLFCIM